MWMRGIGVGIVALIVLLSGRLEARDPFAKWLQGASGYAKGLKEHQEEGRPMWLYFNTDWCPYCRRLNEQILSSSEVEQHLDDIIAVLINPERGTRERAIADQYRVTGYPSFFVLSGGSAVPRDISPFRQSGGQWVSMTPSEFVNACAAAEQSPGATKPPRAASTSKPEHTRSPSSQASVAPSKQITLILSDGTMVIGGFISDTPEAITVHLDGADVTFPRADVQIVEP